MPLPQPEGWEDRFLALERKVNELHTMITNRGGVTTASAGLILPSRSTPDTPASGGHLYGQSGQPWWKASSGSTFMLIPPTPEDPLQTPVTTLPGLTTPNAWPATYNPATGELVQDDLQLHRDKINAIINSLTR
ncbi:hypothetical protein [Streptosporangium sp. NPDC002721]|uniref:hypothetical protein n=1 Tax=Streptosporangium sp. NPDC002721 TaxID=3366188 RepID=UPI0036C75B9C